MLLAADAHPAFEPVRGGGDRARRLAAPELVGGQHLGAGREALIDGHDGRTRIDLDARTPGGAPGRVAGLGDDGEHHLPVKADLPGREDRVVAERGAAIVRSGDVRRGEHRQHSGRGAHRVEIERANRAARGAGAAGRDMHGAGRLGQVVDVGGGPPHVARGAVVREGETDACAGGEVRPGGKGGVGDRRVRARVRFHGETSRVDP